MYRSALCQKATYDGNFIRTDVDGYHGIKMAPQRKGEADLYEVKLAKNGGGQCNWKLSSVMFDVVYKYPKIYGSDTLKGGGGGVMIAFDHNNPPLSGPSSTTRGDLFIKKDYYPWVDEGFLGRYSKTINLAGVFPLYLHYRAPNARVVHFEPVLHTKFLLRSIGPKVKKDGNYTTWIYPDGSVYADGKWHPNLNRLNAIRLAEEAKQ
ncbi:MAG: hypothetical protein ACRER8_04380 [Pseudomonas sp.]|uniref:hypothetical protein n=1 Tax=Pseudomonas sp. TaxID=306 RepID=UPI003D6DC143